MVRFRFDLGTLACAAWLAAGCADPIPGEPPAADPAAFQADVYPVLLRDCGFPGCHASSGRFFQVYGPGRARLPPLEGETPTPVGAPVTDREINAAFERSRSMLSGARDAGETLLVRKPLDVDLGGAPHIATDANGRNIYTSLEDPSFVAIRAWAEAAFQGEVAP